MVYRYERWGFSHPCRASKSAASHLGGLPPAANSFTLAVSCSGTLSFRNPRQSVPEADLQAIRINDKEPGCGPGDACPPARPCAQWAGPGSLREALSSLSALGVVNVQPGKGVFVQAADESPGFAWPFAAQATPLDIFQLRYALEGFAAGLAAVTLTIDELDSLEDNVEAMRKVLKAGDFEAAARLDFEFHQRILLASGNQAMVSILSASARFLESQKLPFIRPNGHGNWQEHRRILRALARRASAAAQKPAGTCTQCGIAHCIAFVLPSPRELAIPKLMRHHSKTQS